MLFTLPRVFKKNSGAENLLLRVHERYSDLSGGGNFEKDLITDVREP